MAAIDRALETTPPKPPPAPVRPFEVTPAVLREVRGGVDVVGAAERQELAEHNRRFSIGARYLATLTNATAKMLWLNQHEHIKNAILAGKEPDLSGHFWTLADAESDFVQRREAVKRALREIALEAAPLVAEAWRAFLKIAEAKAAALEKEERAAAKAWNLNFVPSTACERAKRVAQHAKARANATQWRGESIAAQLAGLVDDL